MSHHFHSFADLAIHLNHVMEHEYKHNLGHALKEIGETIEHRAREKVGEYQFNSGPYAGWAPLAQSTLEKKAHRSEGKGGNPDTPLYATGEFEKDISYKVFADELKVCVGTNQDYMIYNELGTASIPARPVFGPATFEVVPKMLNSIQKLAARGIAGLVYIDSNPNNPGQGVT